MKSIIILLLLSISIAGHSQYEYAKTNVWPKGFFDEKWPIAKSHDIMLNYFNEEWKAPVFDTVGKQKTKSDSLTKSTQFLSADDLDNLFEFIRQSTVGACSDEVKKVMQLWLRNKAAEWYKKKN